VLENISSVEGADPALRISARSFDRLAQYITGELGIQMPPTKVSLIQSRLLRRVRHLGLASLDEYCEHFFSDSVGEEERVHFVNAITTNKTDFFREPQHFKYLTETALPTLAGQHRSVDRRISVWSAACSSGEEPYTLAMVLSEYGAARPGFDFRILATDVSTKVLKMAADGIYTRQQIEPVPRELRPRYLLNGKAGQNTLVRITPALRRMVSFHQLNFMDADYGVREMFDVIFCRNVMIYFNRATQQEVIGKLCRNLHRGGYLFVSHSESLSGLDLPLAPVGASCFRRIEGEV
jgi:chemotaxis protein methyltransferase CheR